MKIELFLTVVGHKAKQRKIFSRDKLLAVRYFMEYYRHYLLGVTFRVRSDHQALVWNFSFQEPKGRVCLWLEILSAYSFTVEYRKGKNHINAEVMSRCYDIWDCKCSDEDMLESLRCGPCNKSQRGP